MQAINQLSYSPTHALHLLIIVIGSHRSKFLHGYTDINQLIKVYDPLKRTIKFYKDVVIDEILR